MLRPRLIVFLMVDQNYVRKSVNFSNSRYIGDPLNTIRIFNDFDVDELVLIDISATREKKEPNYKLIENIASISRMPLCYGGGINNVKQIEMIINLGVEKVSISSEAIMKPELIKVASAEFGSQSIVSCLDVKISPKSNQYEVYIINGTQKVNESLLDCVDFLV